MSINISRTVGVGVTWTV